MSQAEPAGCSKRSSRKAAASEEAKEVQTALRVGRTPFQWILANGNAPTVLPTSETLLLNVEPLSDARTPPAGFFNSLQWRLTQSSLEESRLGEKGTR